MIVRVGNGYLELNDLIEVEKKVKLFDDVSTTEGDFSYSFTIPRTINNVELIQIFSVNSTGRRWARKIPADILNDSGVLIYSGFIRIESDIPNRDYSASFYSGNTNWIASLEYNLREISWDDIHVPAVAESFVNTSGIVFPLVDNGLLKERKSPTFGQDDFRPFIYVKDIINRLLALNGIKLTGNLLNIPEYNQLITTSGKTENQSEIAKRDAKIGKSTNQLISGGSFTTITFNDLSDPYYNSENENFSVSGLYTFDIDVKEVEIQFYIPLGTQSNGTETLRLLKNGTTELWRTTLFPVKRFNGTINNVDDFEDQPVAGDNYRLQVFFSGSSRSVRLGSWFRVTPKRLARVFAIDAIPDMTGSDFISNIFRLFNVIISYNALSKTIEANTFDTVINRPPIDISDHVQVDENNFEEFVSDYAQNNLMVWKDQSSEYVDDYNEVNDRPYASGVLNIDNDFLENTGELLVMDFVASWQQSYVNLGIDLPFTNLITASVKETRNIASVADDGFGFAVFNYAGATIGGSFVVRIYNSSIEEYNGDYYSDLSSSTFNSKYPYLGDATADMDVLNISEVGSDPILLLNHPNQSVPDVMGVDSIYVIVLTPLNTVAIANFLRTDNYHGSLSFEDLKPAYFSNTENMLNKGVKSYATGNLPESVYNNIDFMSPVKVNENQYYPQLISGYKGSKYPVTLELINK